MRGARAVAVRVVVFALAAAAAAWALTRFGALYVAGDSMAPALRRGDLVVLDRRAEAVREGEIVWVNTPGWHRGVLHRVDEVLVDERVVLRGDANPVADLTPAEPRDIRGVVVLVVPTRYAYDVVATIARMIESHAT